jgi:hypothetical protein
MAVQKFLEHDGAGGVREIVPATTGGGGDGQKLAALDVNGKWPVAMMPTGIGADTVVVAASETLAAGDFINLWNDGGTIKARKADATSSGKEAHGFVKDAVTATQNATVYREGNNGAVTGQTVGQHFLSTTAGQSTTTVPTGSGNIVQCIGFATVATNINVEFGQPVELA